MRRLCYLTAATIAVVGLVAGPATAKSSKGGKKAYLGVYTQTVDYELAEAFDLPVDYGVVVNEVIDNSPADEAGLEEDDVIIAFEGSRITDADELVDMINDSRPGDDIILTVIRENEEIKLTVTLAKRPGFGRSLRMSSDPKGRDYLFSFDLDEERAYLGVRLSDLTGQLGDYFGVTKGRGALVTEVHEDSPAEKVGLKAGDVIVAIGEDKVLDSEEAQELVTENEPGDKIEVTVVRDKKEKMFTVELGETEGIFEEYSYSQIDIPDITLKLAPKVKGLLRGTPRPSGWADERYDRFEREMKRLRKELKSLQKEMEELREKLD